MQCCEAEGSKSQDAARPDEAGRRQDAAGRTDKEHEPEQPQRPVSADPDRLGHRPHPEFTSIGEACKPSCRRHRHCKRHHLVGRRATVKERRHGGRRAYFGRRKNRS